MTKLTIKESELKKIIREAISEAVMRPIDESVQNKVDNFPFWENFINVTDPDQFYFVQIIKRYKDNKGMSKAGNYHAGGEFMNYYKVRNRQDLQSIESQVKQICDTQNARAYIVSNPRSEKEINSFLPTYQKRFNSQDPRYVHAYEILAGQPKHDPTKFPTRKMFFLDVDTEDHYVWRLTKMIIKSYGITPVGEYTTPSGGLHIILPDGYAKEIPDLVHDLRVFDARTDRNGKRNFFPDLDRLQLVHANFDGKILLYANVVTNGY